MKKSILFLNLSTLIPCLFFVIGLIPLELIWMFVFVISVINVCHADKKKEFLAYNLILCICSLSGIFVCYFAHKVCEVGFHPETVEEYRLLAFIHVGYMLIVSGTELFIKHLSFRTNNDSSVIPPMPSWNEIVEMMYDKNLDTFTGEIVRCIYSCDKTMRYVILKNCNGFFTYCLETIYQFDEDDWKYISKETNALPAIWENLYATDNKSVFETEEDAIKELKAEGIYKNCFTSDIFNIKK